MRQGRCRAEAGGAVQATPLSAANLVPEDRKLCVPALRRICHIQTRQVSLVIGSNGNRPEAVLHKVHDPSRRQPRLSRASDSARAALQFPLLSYGWCPSGAAVGPFGHGSTCMKPRDK